MMPRSLPPISHAVPLGSHLAQRMGGAACPSSHRATIRPAVDTTARGSGGIGRGDAEVLV